MTPCNDLNDGRYFVYYITLQQTLTTTIIVIIFLRRESELNNANKMTLCVESRQWQTRTHTVGQYSPSSFSNKNLDYNVIDMSSPDISYYEIDHQRSKNQNAKLIFFFFFAPIQFRRRVRTLYLLL